MPKSVAQRTTPFEFRWWFGWRSAHSLRTSGIQPCGMFFLRPEASGVNGGM